MQRGTTCNLSEDILLSDISVYKHRAHDDTVLQHMAYFPENKEGPRNRIRVALLCRTLSISNVYRANMNESADKRYSVVEAHAFRNLDKMKFAANLWAQLGYRPNEISWMDFESEFTHGFVVLLKPNRSTN